MYKIFLLIISLFLLNNANAEIVKAKSSPVALDQNGSLITARKFTINHDDLSDTDSLEFDLGYANLICDKNEASIISVGKNRI